MPKVNQLTMPVENRPGTLAHVCRTLGKAKVNILGFLLTTSGSKGFIKLVVDDVERAREALSEAGLPYFELKSWLRKISTSPLAIRLSRRIRRRQAWCLKSLT